MLTLFNYSLLQELARKAWNARNYRIISPLGQKSFYWMHGRRQKVFEKIQGIRHLVLAECGLH